MDSDLTERTLPAAELALGYRTSLFEQHPDWCVLSATVRLQPGDSAAILAEMQDYLQRRKDKQPIEWPSAGSTFKRPQGAFAGKLIEDCGLRGFTVGGAQISEKHCGFVINRGGATCADVVSLTDQVKAIVLQKDRLYAGAGNSRSKIKGGVCMKFVIVTGLSGAGKSMAVNALEDIGFFCIDNIPVALLPRIVDFALQGENQLNRVAVVMDVRGVRSSEQLEQALSDLDARKFEYEILFLDANDAVIQRRYKETRRQHPITISEKLPITEAIARERRLLQPLRARAQYVIDTSLLSTAQNKERVCSLFLTPRRKPDGPHGGVLRFQVRTAPGGRPCAGCPMPAQPVLRAGTEKSHRSGSGSGGLRHGCPPNPRSCCAAMRACWNTPCRSTSRRAKAS